MGNTLQLILGKYQLPQADYIEIPNVDRNDLAALPSELGFNTGLELGVEEGIYGEVLAKANPGMTIYGVDAWQAFQTYKADPESGKEASYVSQQMCDDFYQAALKRLESYPNYKIVKKSSMEAVKDFADESLDFVYVDADKEYSHVTEDITQWSKKVRPGGIVSGHDYFRWKDPRALMHMHEAVSNYVAANNIKPLIIWGATAKTPGVKRDRYRSWMWVKT